MCAGSSPFWSCDWQVDTSNAHIYVMIKLNAISFLADLSLSLDKSDVVELMLPLFVESLEEGEACVPSLVRLKVGNLVHHSS